VALLGEAVAQEAEGEKAVDEHSQGVTAPLQAAAHDLPNENDVTVATGENTDTTVDMISQVLLLQEAEQEEAYGEIAVIKHS
jgi:hypothetical protein